MTDVEARASEAAMPLPKLRDEVAADPSGYEADFYVWSLGQAELIRGGRLGEADIANLAEEIESLGKEQFSKIRSAMRIVLLHMLKWDYQPERRSRSWIGSIREQRDALEDVIEDSPSLKRRQNEALEKAYRRARSNAADETGLPISRFPPECPYPLDEILNRSFPWPED